MNRLLDYTPEMEFLEEAAGSADAAPAAEDPTITFGADLLDVADDAELDELLRDLVAAVAAAGRMPLGAALGQALVAELKRAARPLMPIRSNGAGAADLKTRAARIFGMELEGLSPEDKEFEVARQFVRLCIDAVGNAAAMARGGAARAVAGAALRQAARRYAPGLLRPQGLAAPAAPGAPSQGRWRREGGRIVVLNC